ncbi:MAG: glycosyltransferase [Desulfuromonadales bacterium]|nr:MAG: glycosyltransferase [Desulfuromonadales bacterium]
MSALIVFAKRPVPGCVKTRLTPPFLPEEAAELYRRMLLDILAKTGQMADIDRFVFFEQGDGSREYFATLVSDGEVYSQEGDGLGDRMAGAFRTVFGLGYDRVAIIGTDSPDLPAAFIGRAYGLLDDSGVDAVFGPSDDGGYYLLAMKRFQPELFTGIPWSTGEVLERSLERSTVAGIATALLPVWHDIDTAADLLRPELADPANGAPLTREFILRHPPHTPASPDRR